MSTTKTSPRSADSTEADILTVDVRDGIATVTLNRPRQRNALSLAMLGALQSTVDSLSDDASVSVVILRANGPGFCSGHDLKELTAHRSDADRGRAFFAETMATCARMMQSIVNSPKPYIAEVHGIAAAAGCQLVATCDLAIAGEGAQFNTPGVNIGLFCSSPMVALSRNVSRKHAMEMLLLGENMTAAQAKDFGLVNRVVPDQALSEATEAMARKIADKSPLTVAIGKKAFYEQIEKPLGDAYDYAADVMVRNMLVRDAEEGIGAFIEKRQPSWEGR